MKLNRCQTIIYFWHFRKSFSKMTSFLKQELHGSLQWLVPTGWPEKKGEHVKSVCNHQKWRIGVCSLIQYLGFSNSFIFHFFFFHKIKFCLFLKSFSVTEKTEDKPSKVDQVSKSASNRTSSPVRNLADKGEKEKSEMASIILFITVHHRFSSTFGSKSRGELSILPDQEGSHNYN